MKITIVAMNTTAAMTVRRSRFFSHTPLPALALYMDEAIMSETPVPLPEHKDDEGDGGDGPSHQQNRIHGTHELTP